MSLVSKNNEKNGKALGVWYEKSLILKRCLMRTVNVLTYWIVFNRGSFPARPKINFSTPGEETLPYLYVNILQTQSCI